MPTPTDDTADATSRGNKSKGGPTDGDTSAASTDSDEVQHGSHTTTPGKRITDANSRDEATHGRDDSSNNNTGEVGARSGGDSSVSDGGAAAPGGDADDNDDDDDDNDDDDDDDDNDEGEDDDNDDDDNNDEGDVPIVDRRPEVAAARRKGAVIAHLLPDVVPDAAPVAYNPHKKNLVHTFFTSGDALPSDWNVSAANLADCVVAEDVSDNPTQPLSPDTQQVPHGAMPHEPLQLPPGDVHLVLLARTARLPKSSNSDQTNTARRDSDVEQQRADDNQAQSQAQTYSPPSPGAS